MYKESDMTQSAGTSIPAAHIMRSKSTALTDTTSDGTQSNTEVRDILVHPHTDTTIMIKANNHRNKRTIIFIYVAEKN